MTVEADDLDPRWSLRLPNQQALAETRELAAIISTLTGGTVGDVVHAAVRAHAQTSLGKELTALLVAQAGKLRQPSA